MITNKMAMARIAIQAPAGNFVISTTTSTVPVTLSPNALMIRLIRMRRRAAGSASVRNSRDQCRTMPAGWL